MARRIRCLLLLVAFLSPGTALGQEPLSWLCTLDKVTGFMFKDGAWISTNFTAKGGFIVERIRRERDHGIRYQLRSTDSKYWSSCDVDHEFVSCQFPTEVVLNTKSLRFLWSYRVGYIDGRDDNQNTPAIGIGKCSPS